MSTELDVDPSDPHSILMNANNSNNTNSASEEDDSDAVGGAQDLLEDWSKFGSFWSPHLASSIKSYNDFMDLSDFSSSVTMSMPMDTDLGIAMGMDYPYSSMMGIDSASLQFNPAATGYGLGGGFGLAQDVSTGFMDSCGASAAGLNLQHQQQNGMIAPLFTQGSASPESFAKERRLSVTSSSSSSVSGASLSPMPNHYNASSPPPSGYTSDNVSTKDEPNFNSTPEPVNSNPNDPATELANRVRQTAGVMLAVPVNGFGSSFQAGANISAGKLPIPRLNRPSTTLYAKSTTTSAPLSSSSSTLSSAESTPPPTTPPSASHSPLSVSTSTSAVSASVATPSTSALPRPKTSHTTIERRYRTNLNARIQSLRMAVPALRVLEDHSGSKGKKIKKNIKGGVIVKGGGIGIGVECSEDGSVDVIDERGFVDGVKVARKCSKANVLGKAVEYIRVLKRRERRLKAELAGVKVLVEGLVGGPVLIREWEKQWKARFGGEEKDEVEEDDEEAEVDDDESEDEEGEDGDEEGAGRKRKRARVAPTSTGGISKKVDSKKEKKTTPSSPVVMLAGEQIPEKRKRGRPRKILPPPVTLEPVATASGPPAHLPAAVVLGLGSVKQDEAAEMPSQWQQQQQHSPPQRFLLAVFALFSFFNSPLTTSVGRDHSSHNHHHHRGKVLTPLYPPLVYSPEIVSQFVQYPPSPVVDVLSAAPTPMWKHYVQLFHLAVSFIVLASLLGNWFGFGVSGFKITFEKRSWGWKSSRTGKVGKGNIDWIRFAEERVLLGEASSLSHLERFQIYRAISDREGVSLGSLVTAAIALKSANDVFGGLARMKASTIWDDARRRVRGNNKVKVNEEIVFGSMGLDEACERLAGGVERRDFDEMSDGEREYELIEVLACDVVKERVRSHLGRIFVDFVGGHEDEEEEEGKSEEERRRRKTVDASRELGGSVEEMGRLFERIWKIGVGSVDMGDVECAFSNVQSSGGVNEEVRALFVAFVLYARLFGGFSSESSEETESDGGLSSSSDTVIVSNSSLLSPPPSPNPSKVTSSKRAKMMLELRRVLGCRVFEGCDDRHECGAEERKVGSAGVVEGLEEARDLIVDLIVDFERKDR